MMDNKKSIENSKGKMLKEETTERFVRCDCYHHAMVVNVDKEDSQVYVSQWSYGNGERDLSWRERLRYIWRILSKGKPYEDEIVLSFSNAYELGQFLVKQCAESLCQEHRMTMSDPNKVAGTIDFTMGDGSKHSIPVKESDLR